MARTARMPSARCGSALGVRIREEDQSSAFFFSLLLFSAARLSLAGACPSFCLLRIRLFLSPHFLSSACRPPPSLFAQLFVFSLFFISASPTSAPSAPTSPTTTFTTTIYNDRWRRDTQGRIVNAHDGQLVSFDGGRTYLLYGTVYAHCTQAGPVCDQVCGYDNNTFAVLSSPDLAQWTLHSDNILPSMLLDNRYINYWEANVGFNRATGRYVMSYWTSRYGFVNNSVAMASSASPFGNFTNDPPINLVSAKVISDTVNLFVDDDNTAYLRVNTRDPPLRHTIEKLTPDWRGTTGEYGVIFVKNDYPWYDGGGVVKHAGRYFTMLSFDCCFCQWGSDALVFVADNPVGTWLPQPPLKHGRTLPFHFMGTVVGGGKGDGGGEGEEEGGEEEEGEEAIEWKKNDLKESASGSRVQRARRGLCNVTGYWSGVQGGAAIPTVPNIFIQQQSAANGKGRQENSTLAIYADGSKTPFAGSVYANGSVVIPAFPGLGFLQGQLGAYGNASDACSQISWINYSPPHSFWCRYPACRGGLANWTNEANFCADGSLPPLTLPNMYINPCSVTDVDGTNFTVPAQQFNIATLYTAQGPLPMYFGELFRSSPDGIKAHDYQAWIPLAFTADNYIRPMQWLASWTVDLQPQ